MKAAWLATIILAVLKLLGVVPIGWFWALLPLGVMLAAYLAMILLGMAGEAMNKKTPGT